MIITDIIRILPVIMYIIGIITIALYNFFVYIKYERYC